MVDEELNQLASEAWTLTEAGKQALQEELERRALKTALATSRLPEEPQERWVTLRRFVDTPEALLAKGALDSAGIENFLGDETTIRMDWLWSNALGGIKLCVRSRDVETAAQLLDQKIQESFSVDGIGEFEQPRCPKCQSVDISYSNLDKRSAYVGMLLAGLPIHVHREFWKCNTCGHKWHPPKDE